MRHFCVDCGRDYPSGFHTFCESCNGMVDVQYDLRGVRLADSANPYVRFAALLPLEQSADRLPSANYTPLVHARRLGQRIGVRALYLKNETVQPTRTTKDRMAAIALAYLHERGVRKFCASSTGNSSSALARQIAAFGDMHLYLFSAEKFVSRVQYADHPQVTHFGVRGASFVEASDCAGRYAKRHGFTAEGGFFNPARREGLKLAFMEASEQAPEPIDWYVQAVSSGMGVYGTYKGAKELRELGRLSRLPRLLCVQQESCAPMVRAFAEGSKVIRPEHRVPNPNGIAEAILRGDPTRAYPYLMRAVVDSDGGFVGVSETEIRAARQMLEAEEGIGACFSAAAALAGVIRRTAQDRAMAEATVMVNLTGSDRPEDSTNPEIHWVTKGTDGWVPPPPGVLNESVAARYH